MYVAFRQACFTQTPRACLILSRKKRNIQHARLDVRERDGARDGAGFHVAFVFRDDERRFTARAP